MTSDDLRRASFTPQWLIICLNLCLSSAISFKHPSTSPPWANVLVWEHKSKLLFVEGKVPKSSLGFAVIVWVLLKNAGQLTAWRQPTGRKAWNKKRSRGAALSWDALWTVCRWWGRGGCQPGCPLRQEPLPSTPLTSSLTMLYPECVKGRRRHRSFLQLCFSMTSTACSYRLHRTQ